jgi:hypothetical protein
LTKAPKLPIRLPIKLNADGERKREMRDLRKIINFSTITYTQTGGTGPRRLPEPWLDETHNGLYEATNTGFNEGGGKQVSWLDSQSLV